MNVHLLDDVCFEIKPIGFSENEEKELNQLENLEMKLISLRKIAVDLAKRTKMSLGSLENERDNILEYLNKIGYVAIVSQRHMKYFEEFGFVNIIGGILRSFEEMEDEEGCEKICQVISNLCGRNSSNTFARIWRFKDLKRDVCVDLVIQESSFLSSDLGCLTWPASCVVGCLLIQQKFPFLKNLNSKKILELGAGTGIVGLVCNKLGANFVKMTDFNEGVLNNLKLNLKLNGINHFTRAKQQQGVGHENLEESICQNLSFREGGVVDIEPLDWMEINQSDLIRNISLTSLI